MDQKSKKVLIGGLIAILFVMLVGYAAFSSQLNIRGTARVSTAWDVHIASITPGGFVGSAQNIAATVGEGGLSATFETDLKAPGDSVTYSVTVVNDGSLKAKLSDLTFHQSQDQTPANKPAITYEKEGIEIGNTLNPGADVTFTITVKFPSEFDVKEFTEAQIENELEMVLTYVQDTTE